jgi:hypothetical protein
LFPTELPVTALTMNYAIAFLGGILIASTVWWFISGRKYYHGPIIEAVVVNEDNSSGAEDVAEDKKLEV